MLTPIVLDAHIVIGAFLEEKKLRAFSGEQYEEDQKQVPMFLPIKRLKVKRTRWA